MTNHRPCADPKNDPNDWFIRKDGRQYAEDTFVTEVQLNTALEDAGFDLEDLAAAEAMHERLEERAIKDALRRRRHAKDECHTACYFRNECLRQALDEGHGHGTWGGYFEEEIREVRKQINRRRRASTNNQED